MSIVSTKSKEDEEEKESITRDYLDNITNSINATKSYGSTDNTYINSNSSNGITRDYLDSLASIINPQEVEEKPNTNNQNLISTTVQGNADSFVVSTDNSTLKEDHTEEIEEAAEELSSLKANQNVSAETPSKETETATEKVSNSPTVSLASSEETENATKLTEKEELSMKAANEAETKNANIEKGGVDAFNEFVDTVTSNILGGFQSVAAGLADVGTTLAAWGVRGVESISRLLGNDEAGDTLESAYDTVVETGSDLKAHGDYESTVTSNIDNDFVRISGQATDVITKMVASQAIGTVAGVSGTAIQGLSVGGSSAQEVLDKNKDNITQATVTGVAKGYVSYFTEKMFDANILTSGTEKSSIDKMVNKLISEKISSQFGKEFANKTVGIIGENLEELAEDNIDYLVDKVVNDEDLPEWEQWWANTSETAKVTTITTIVMNLMGLGSESFSETEKDMEAQKWITKAQEIIDQEDMAIHYNTDQIKSTSTMDNFYVTQFNQDGTINNVISTLGKEITASDNQNLNNIVEDLGITPAVVKDSNTNSYMVIDGNTGVVLDSAYYENILSAENSFYEKIGNLTEQQLKTVKNQINKANYTMTNEIINMITTAKEQIVQNEQQQTTKPVSELEKYNDVQTLLTQITDKSIYNQSSAMDIFEMVSNKIENVEANYQGNDFYIYSKGSDGQVTYGEKVDGLLYSGTKIKSIIRSAIQNADTSNINSTTNTTNNTNPIQTSSKSNSSDFYSGAKDYAVEDIKKVTEPFMSKSEYSIDEVAEIWNEINENDYDVIYDYDSDVEGKTVSYIAIEEDGDNLVVNQYDNNDNIVKSQTLNKQENGNYSSEDIVNTLDSVAKMIDEDRPIKGQIDIEGNEVLNLKEKPSTENEDVSKSVEKFSKAKQNIDRDTILNIVDSLDIPIKDNASIINNTKMSKKAGKNQKPNIINITEIFDNVTNQNAKTFRNSAIQEALTRFRDTEVVIKDTDTIAEINKSGIDKTYSGAVTKEKIQTADNIKDIIEQGIYGFTTYNEDDINHILYHHFFTPVNYQESNGLIRVVIKEFSKDSTANDKFYYHQLEYISNKKIEGINSALPQPVGSKDFELTPSTNNSITQNETTVKSENTAINKDMQKSENDTSKTSKSKKATISEITDNSNINISQNENNDEVHYMKKNSTNKSNNNATNSYDNKGRRLSKQQETYFKNSKVRDENNNLITVYHGTDFKFNIFKNKQAQNGRAITDGYYFTTIAENAEGYGKNVKEVYIDIENPFYLHNSNGVVSELQSRGYDIFNLIQENKLYTDEGGYPTAKSLKKFLAKEGFDGVITLEGEDEVIGITDVNTQIVAFKSNQIKNTDNLSPTSNEDIRYMKTNNTNNTEQNNNKSRFAKRTSQSKNINENATLTNAEREGSYIEQEIQKIEKTGNWDYSIPVTKRSEIKKTIEDYLGIGIKKGKFREQAYGIYKSNRDVIRTKELKDIDTILHETGHALDLGNRLEIDKETISDELLTAVNKYGGYETDSRSVQLEEGFAEVIREYSVIPEQAKIDYPQTVTVIEQLRNNNKQFNKFMTKLQEQTYNYIHQSPENRVLSNMSIGEQTDKAVLSKSYIQQEVMRNIYDKDYALKSAVKELAKSNGKKMSDIKASENAYNLVRLSSGIGDKVTSMLSNGYIDENGNKLMPGLSQLGEILDNNPDRFNDLREYLVSQRDVEYKAKNLKTGIRDADSKATILKFENDSQIQEAAKVIYDTLDGVMQYAVNNGLINQDVADSLKESNAFYIPMQRVIENQGNQTGRRGAVTDIIKSRTGSELDIKDVLENIVSNSSNIIQQVENNNILRALYKQGESSGLTGAVYDVISTPLVKTSTTQLKLWESELQKQGVDTSKLDLNKTLDLFAPNNKVDSKNLITSFINEDGKRIYLQFNDELIFNSLMNMDKKFMSQILNINSKMNMPLRYGATMANLGFAIPNMISDTAQAAVYSTAGFIPVVDNALGVLDILTATNSKVKNFMDKVAPEYANRINNLYNMYEQSGAKSSTRLSQYRKSTQEVMRDVYGTNRSEDLGIDEKFKPLKRLLDVLTYIPEVSEQSTRFEVFKKNYNYYLRNGETETDARIQAALESRDATQDFGRTGNITREINQLIPFSAARVGSAYTFAEKITSNPKQVGMRIAVLTAIAMGIKAIGYDDKEIEELNQRKKNDNFVLKVGDTVVTIKKPQGILRSIINLAEYIQDLGTGHIEEGKEAERLEEWLTNSIMDNMPADEVSGLVPNAVAPLIENAINKDFYYNTEIVNSYDLDLPNSEQYYEYNSQLAIWLGSIFNYSPAKIDNLISGYFGGLGTQVTGIIDYISGKLGFSAEKADMGAESNTIGKRFVVNVNSNSSSLDEIYDLQTELTKKKNGGTITDEESEELETITSAISSISKINKQIKAIKADLTLSAQEKAEQIKELQKQRTDTARQALGKDLIYDTADQIETTKFYPTSSTLSKNNYVLTLTDDMKQEYAETAQAYYEKYESQGIYSEEKLEEIKTKAKTYAKNVLFKEYKNLLVRNSS